MPLDGAILGNMAAQQMHALEQDYGDDPEVQIVGAMTIVRVLKKIGPDQYVQNIRKRHNMADPLEAIGLLQVAEHQILHARFAQPGFRPDEQPDE
jgi:hypothetical protein